MIVASSSLVTVNRPRLGKADHHLIVEEREDDDAGPLPPWSHSASGNRGIELRGPVLPSKRTAASICCGRRSSGKRSFLDRGVSEDDGVPDAIEELWIHDGKVVELRKATKTIKTFTGEDPVTEVCWVRFPKSGAPGADQGRKPVDHLDCIAIRENKTRLKIFADSGEEFLVSLPMEMSKMWNSRYGLILDRGHGSGANGADMLAKGAELMRQPPKLLALQHPLDDLTRILIRWKGEKRSKGEGDLSTPLPTLDKFDEWLDRERYRLLFTNEDPSLAVTFDLKKGCHSVWLIRKVCDSDDLNVEEENVGGRRSEGSQLVHGKDKVLPPFFTPESSDLNRSLLLQNSSIHSSFQDNFSEQPQHLQPHFYQQLQRQRSSSRRFSHDQLSSSSIASSFSQLNSRSVLSSSAAAVASSGSPVLPGRPPHCRATQPSISTSFSGQQATGSASASSLRHAFLGKSLTRHSSISGGINFNKDSSSMSGRPLLAAAPGASAASKLTSANMDHLYGSPATSSTRRFIAQYGSAVPGPPLGLSSRHNQSPRMATGVSTAVKSTINTAAGVAFSSVTAAASSHHSSIFGCSNTHLDSNKFLGYKGMELIGTDEPLPPDFSLCFERLWTEASDTDEEVVSQGDSTAGDRAQVKRVGIPADKVFIYQDVTGQRQLCFLHKDKGIINLLAFCEVPNSDVLTKNESPKTCSFGKMTQIGCGNVIDGGNRENHSATTVIDGVPIDSLGMVLTIEKTVGFNSTSTSLALYTGSFKVAKVHLEPPVPALSQLATIAHEISTLHIDTCVAGSKKIQAEEEISDKYRRSSLITSSRPPSAMDAKFNESFNMLSPVPLSQQTPRRASAGIPHFGSTPSSRSNHLTSEDCRLRQLQYGSLRDAFVEYDNGSLVHLKLPPLASSSLVKRCLMALKATLPEAVAVGLICQWFRVRNAPGSQSISCLEEWELFIKCLLGQMGYSAEELKMDLFNVSDSLEETGIIDDDPMNGISSAAACKKMKPSDNGCDEDWQCLLESRHHDEAGEALSYTLGIPCVLKYGSNSNLKEKKPLVAKCDDTTKAEAESVNDDKSGSKGNQKGQKRVDPGSPLFKHIATCLWAFHLLYEDMKLDRSFWPNLVLLAKFLSKISADLQLISFVQHYWKDFPLKCAKTVEQSKTNQMVPELLLRKILPPVRMQRSADGRFMPLSIFDSLNGILANKWDLGTRNQKFHILDGVTNRTRDILAVFYFLTTSVKMPRTSSTPYIASLDNIFEQGAISAGDPYFFQVEDKLKKESPHWNQEQLCRFLVDFMVHQGYDMWTISSTFPPVVSLPILAAIAHLRLVPPSDASTDFYHTIGRLDLASQCSMDSVINKSEGSKATSANSLISGTEPAQDCKLMNASVDIGLLLASSSNSTSGSGDSTYVEDGMEDVENEITKLRWPLDRRLGDVKRMLQSSRPVVINVEQRPEMSDHDFVEEQERHLQALCVRTMALPVGRGAISLRTTNPLPTETLPVPKLCLTGKAPPRGTTIDMDHIDVVPNMERWPSFHNGVAAGLRLFTRGSVTSTIVDSNWITFNKPRDSSHPNDLVEHGGFLMALGLNGHLSSLGKLESFDYLIKGHDMISIGILLGTCAAKKGTMDVLATKKVATQLEALLPSTATELPLSHTTQVAALSGLGLLYLSTGHRRMAEVCLGELGKPPGPEMENCTDRESYSLAAGLSLGMITLGQGEELSKGPLSDLRLPETLYHHMVGGPRDSTLGRHRFRSPSYQIQEGDTINIDVTSPGATLALGLMFFRSGNKEVAEWMSAPNSTFLLEFVRPDFLMLRTLAKGLIMFDSITPNSTWIDSHVPESIRPHCLVRPTPNTNLDYETINQAYCNIISGAGLAMAIRFAGSCNSQAFEVLNRITLRLLAISKRSVAELAGKATIEQTICVMVLSLAIVMSGSGDIEVIRLVRLLRSRVGPKNPTVTYGSQMALHLALGLLFLGGGRYTLSTKPQAVAAMICAFFPKFPTHSNDNRYHLQALRHLYVLAAEPRLLVPRDISSGLLEPCTVEMTLSETRWYKSCKLVLFAPAMLPELNLLSKVCINDPRYHTIVFESATASSREDEESSWKHLKDILDPASIGHVNVQLKAGCLSYKVDPKGYRSLNTQYLERNQGFRWSLTSSRLTSVFHSERNVGTFAKVFMKPQSSSSARLTVVDHVLGSILYECASQEKLDVLQLYLYLFQRFVWHLDCPDQPFLGHQMWLLKTLSETSALVNRLVNPEIVSSLVQSLYLKLDRYLGEPRGRLFAKELLGPSGKPTMGCDSSHQVAGAAGELNAIAHLLMFQNLLRVQPMGTGGEEHNPLKIIRAHKVSGSGAFTLSRAFVF